FQSLLRLLLGFLSFLVRGFTGFERRCDLFLLTHKGVLAAIHKTGKVVGYFARCVPNKLLALCNLIGKKLPSVCCRARDQITGLFARLRSEQQGQNRADACAGQKEEELVTTRT